MNQKQMYDTSREIYMYFTMHKDELSEEDRHLFEDSFHLYNSLSHMFFKHLDKNEDARQKKRDEYKHKLFAEEETVYEGIVDGVLEPVYAANHTEFTRKATRYANMYPAEEQYVNIRIYKNTELVDKMRWTRKSTRCLDGSWKHGIWKVEGNE